MSEFVCKLTSKYSTIEATSNSSKPDLEQTTFGRGGGLMKEKGKKSASSKEGKYRKESMLNGIKNAARKSWAESKQREKECTRKRHGKDSTNLPEAKKASIICSRFGKNEGDVLDIINVFQIMPSTASPGRSIIMKKKINRELRQICL
ncbi:Pumilio domain-containing protein 12 [Dirofilaria immitis]|nr:Pumilio domain-containing protein 12 [Dirofilaria immitis]